MTPPYCRHSADRDSLDRMFESVSHPARRHILFAVRDENSRSAAELASGTGSGDSQEGGHSRVELHHIHLPHLDETGFIDWDRRTDTITKGPDFEEIRPLLTWIDERTDGPPDDPH